MQTIDCLNFNQLQGIDQQTTHDYFDNISVPSFEKKFISHVNSLKKEDKLPPSQDQIVYLTFDDGPSQYTEAILDVLERYDIKATFFMLEKNILNNKSTVQRMMIEGHQVALHGSSHNKNLIYRSPQSVVDEMDACNRAIFESVGFTTNIIRVPYGSKPWMPQPYRDAIVQEGYRMWDWNIDSGDTKAVYVSPSVIKQNVVNLLKSKKNSVILFHDKQCTLDALPSVLDYLISNGYSPQILTQSMIPYNFWNDIRVKP